MNRRKFLKGTSVGAATSLIAAPAIAQSLPTIKWRLASSFPKSLDALFNAADNLANRVKQLTQDKFTIRVFAANEVVPALQVLTNVQQGTIECGHSASYYYIGINKAFAFDTTMPFGLNARQQNAWMYYGGGIEALRELFKDHSIVQFPGGNTGTQMGGWFRREVKSLADLKGLKMRIPGMGGEIMSKLGVIPQTLPAGDLYPSLERGTIDAVEWVGPYDDEKLGFYKIAKHYYYPGWWEPSAQLSFYVNSKEWEKLPKVYQQAFEIAAAETNVRMLADYDFKNTAAMHKLKDSGVQFHKFTDDIMKAAMKTAFELYEDEASKNAIFKKIYTSWKKFREDQYQWSNVSESGMANFIEANLK